jgi:hypothetical protein
VGAYYIVKLGDKPDEKTDFFLIKISLTQFEKDFARLNGQGRIKEFIHIPDMSDAETARK